MNRAERAQLQLPRTKGNPGSHLLNGTIERQLNGTGIPDSA
jgi:hypothetical protein